jgi:hypothetical protein
MNEMNKMNPREKYLFDNIKNIFTAYDPSTLERGLGYGTPLQISPQLTSGFMNKVYTMHKAKPFFNSTDSGGFSSLENYKLKNIDHIIENIKKEIHGGNLIIPLKTIKQYINETVNNIIPK